MSPIRRVQQVAERRDRGREGFRLPSLRTVRAVFPHTALQSRVSTSGAPRAHRLGFGDRPMIAKRRRRPHRCALPLTPSSAPTPCHRPICAWLPPVSHSGSQASDPHLATRHSEVCACHLPVDAHHASYLPSHRDGFAARPSRCSRSLATMKAVTPAAVTSATGLSAYSACLPDVPSSTT